jgi:anthranilate 1,2-dioxygenase small subunit
MSSAVIERVDANHVASEASFLVVRIMQDGASLLFASGRYLDRIVLAPEPLYEERVVVCDSRRFDTLLAIPL